MKLNVTIEVKDDFLDYLAEIIIDNEPISESEAIELVEEIICDDYRAFFFVRKEISEEVLRRVKGVSTN